MTSTALTRIEAGTHEVAAPRAIDAARLLERWQEGRSPETRRAYTDDMAHFAAFLSEYLDTPAPINSGQAIDQLLHMPLGDANEAGRAWRSAMTEDGLAPATVNRRIAALRSLVDVARQFGMVTWALELKNVATASYRDTRGPGREAVQAMVDHAAAQEDPLKAARDVAVLRLLYDLALRRIEVSRLNLEDVDLKRGLLKVQGKGKREPIPLTLPPETIDALKAWIAKRGRRPGALILNLDRSEKDANNRRLAGDGIYRIIRALGEAVGVAVRPHGIRHTSITDALEATSGDVRAVRKHSRHAKLETLIVYDDNREDKAGEVARTVAKGVKAK